MKTAPSTQTCHIQVIYPHPEQPIYEDSTFIMGQVQHIPASHALFINKQAVPMSANSFFSWKVPVKSGLNPITLEVRQSEASPPVTQTVLALHGVPPFPVLPATPLAIHEETLLPAENLWLSSTDTLHVAVSASHKANVSFTIPGLVDTPIPMTPLPSELPFVDTREAIFAHLHWTHKRIPTQSYYQAFVPVSELLTRYSHPGKTLPDTPLPLVLHVQGHSQTSQALSKTFPGHLTISDRPQRATIKTDRAITRTAPENGARLTPQRAGTQLLLDGYERGWFRARLSQEERFYIAADDLVHPPLPALFHNSESPSTALLGSIPATTMGAPASLALIRTERIGEWSSRVHLTFSGQPASVSPIRIESLPSPQGNRLHVRLYNVCSRCDFMHYPPQDTVIQQLHWRPVSENTIELWIDLNRPLSGYDYALQNGEWQITVKALPATIADTRILIDPGHGGTESGSVGLNGLPEKALNLTVSRLLQDALTQAGFSQVEVTRNQDKTLSLAARGQAVLNTQADIVLSIHHNALPDGRDPLAEHGACTFYYHAFAKPLADKLLQGLTTTTPHEDTLSSHGVFYDSLYMTRIHQATAVLVELGFFTYPEDFERLIQPAFQKAEARRLAEALKAYCQSRI